MEKHNINAFEDLSVPKALAKFVIPSVISQLTMLILNLTDAFFVGRTEDTFQISAMTITFPIVMMIGCIATIFAAGGNANIAAALGTNNKERAKRISVFAVYTTLGIVALMIIALLIWENPLLSLLGADANSIGYCHGYIFWVFYCGALPLAFCQVMSQMFIAEGETKIASIGIAGAGIINAVLDPIFIFPLGMGVAGAGCATFVANICNVIFFLIIFYKRRNKSVLSLNPKYYTVRDGIAVRTITTGFPAGLNMLLLNGCDFIRNTLLGSYGGQIELASWGVVQKIGNAFTQICVGIGQGVRPLVAYNYNAQNFKRSKSIVKGSFVIMCSYTVVCLLLSLAIPEILVSLFLPVEEAMPTAVSFLQTWMIGIIAVGVLELLNSIFQAMSKWKISMANIAANRICLMGLMFVMVRVFSAFGVIVSQPIIENIAAVVMVIFYVSMIRRDTRSI